MLAIPDLHNTSFLPSSAKHFIDSPKSRTGGSHSLSCIANLGIAERNALSLLATQLSSPPRPPTLCRASNNTTALQSSSNCSARSPRAVRTRSASCRAADEWFNNPGDIAESFYAEARAMHGFCRIRFQSQLLSASNAAFQHTLDGRSGKLFRV